MSKVVQTLTSLRDQPDDELQQLLAKTRDDLFRAQLGQYTNQVTSTAGIAGKRRDIARILTVLRGRALGIDRPPHSLLGSAAHPGGAGVSEGQAKKAQPDTSSSKGTKKS